MTSDNPHLLLVSSESGTGGELLSVLNGTGFTYDHVHHLAEDVLTVESGPYDVFLIEVNQSTSGAEELKTVRSLFADVPVIFVGEGNADEHRVTALSSGAQDFLGLEHLNSSLLERVVSSALGRQQFITGITRTRDEAEAVALRQSIVARIGQIIGATDELQTVYEDIANEIRRGMNFDRLAVHLIDWETNTATVHVMATGNPVEDATGHTRPLKNTKTASAVLSDDVVVMKRDQLVREASRSDFARLGVEMGFEVVVGAPMVAGDLRVGVLFAASREKDLDAPANLELLRQVANQMAGPVSLWREKREAEQRSLRQSIIAEISQLVSTADELDEAYAAIADQIRRSLHFDRLAVHLIDWKTETFKVHQIQGERHELDDLGTIRLLSESKTYEAALADEVTVLDRGVLEEAADTMYAARWTLDNGYQIQIGAPLVVGHRRIGVLFAASREPGLDSPANLELFRDVARQMAGPIGQWNDRQEAERTAFEQSKLAAIGQKLIHADNFDQAVQHVMPDIWDIVPCNSLLLNIANDDGQTFRARFLMESATNPLSVEESRPLEGSATQYVMSTNQPLLLDEELNSGSTSMQQVAALSELGYRSGIVIPLTVGAEPIGALIWLDRTESRYSPHSIDLAISVGMLVAGALANSELLRRTKELLGETRKRVDLEDENARLQISNEMKAQVLSNVSHELRTPLTSVLAFADMLHRNRSGRMVERDLEQIEVIRRGGRQLELIINDLLTTSSVDSGAFELVRTDISMTRLLDNAVRAMQPVVKSRSQTIEREYETVEDSICVDPGRMTQVLCNLISNASKYSPTDTSISIGATVCDGRLEISVSDHGPGIPPDMRRAVFERYVRADEASVRAQTGTGLGLHIARTIIEAHGGSIHVDPTYANGARFTVTIENVAGAGSCAEITADIAPGRSNVTAFRALTD